MHNAFLSLALLLLSQSVFTSADPCLDSWNIAINGCNYDTLIAEIDQLLVNATCDHNAETELHTILQVDMRSDDMRSEAQDQLAEICGEADIPFGKISGKGNIFDKEFYDGGTYWNEERESVTEDGIVNNRLSVDPGARIEQIYQEVSRNRGIQWPEGIVNFEDCELRAAMCCWVQDRQANDGNGNCATPYDEGCVDADPSDNTDVCYVDMSRAPTSSRTEQGFSVFEHNAEEPTHCHGLAWANDSTDPSGRYKGNNLFYISMRDHLTRRGYVRNVPGAPMCGCVEKMPVVTRADCQEVVINNEDITFSYSINVGLRATVTELNMSFNSCEGADNNNNDLAAYYQRLVNEGKVTQEEKEAFDEHIVGKYYCREAIDSFLDTQGLIKSPSCRYSDPETCGCNEVRQKDYRGTINQTVNGLECQRWDQQAPHTHSRTRKNYPDAGLSENYCRNPDNEPGGAWCYTTNPEKRWDYCAVPDCQAIEQARVLRDLAGFLETKALGG